MSFAFNPFTSDCTFKFVALWGTRLKKTEWLNGERLLFPFGRDGIPTQLAPFPWKVVIRLSKRMGIVYGKISVSRVHSANLASISMHKRVSLSLFSMIPFQIPEVCITIQLGIVYRIFAGILTIFFRLNTIWIFLGFQYWAVLWKESNFLVQVNSFHATLQFIDIFESFEWFHSWFSIV